MFVAGVSGGTSASKNHRPARDALVFDQAHEEHLLRAEGFYLCARLGTYRRHAVPDG